MQGFRHEYGLDKPLMVQYFDWVGGIFRGNMGIRYITTRTSILFWQQRFPITLYLGIMAFIISNVFGILLGVIGRHKARDLDRFGIYHSG